MLLTINIYGENENIISKMIVECKSFFHDVKYIKIDEQLETNFTMDFEELEKQSKQIKMIKVLINGEEVFEKIMHQVKE